MGIENMDDRKGSKSTNRSASSSGQDTPRGGKNTPEDEKTRRNRIDDTNMRLRDTDELMHSKQEYCSKGVKKEKLLQPWEKENRWYYYTGIRGGKAGNREPTYPPVIGETAETLRMDKTRSQSVRYSVPRQDRFSPVYDTISGASYLLGTGPDPSPGPGHYRPFLNKVASSPSSIKEMNHLEKLGASPQWPKESDGLLHQPTILESPKLTFPKAKRVCNEDGVKDLMPVPTNTPGAIYDYHSTFHPNYKPWKGKRYRPWMEQRVVRMVSV